MITVPEIMANIAPSLTGLLKKRTVQSISRIISSTIECGIPLLSSSAKAPLMAWVRVSAVPYVPGKKVRTFCKKSPN